MSFTKFTIKNFKCFREEQTLFFAQPSKELMGSGITYIVGANNSGKTTIIEGLSIKDERKIKSSERINELGPVFNLYDGETLKRQCQLVRPESYTIKEEPKLSDNELFEIISSRRHWQSHAGNNYSDLGQSFRSSYDFLNRQNQLDVASELKTIERDNVKYEEFLGLVKNVISEFTKFAVAYEDHEFIEYISNFGVRHKAELLGDGVITVIRILLHLYVEKENPLIIDEPELSLHPQAQKKLIKLIAKYAKKRQIIISTHSPYFIDWKYIANGAKLNRIAKAGDESSKIYQLKDSSSYNSLINGANWQQPFLMDEVAKEVFFADDNILFLEGQEDVGLLRNEFLETDVHLFGYGVRGCDKFELALTMSKDLGFQKVAAILDKGEKEDAVFCDLQNKFEDYKIIQWNKNDIRDKEEHTSREKIGYFNKNGKKKGGLELDDFENKIGEIKQYLEKNESG